MVDPDPRPRAGPAPSRLGPLRSSRFRVFFAGTISANLAQWMQQFVMGWLVVQLAVEEAVPERASLYLGVVGFARLLPAITVGLAAGVAADRFDRAKLLATMQLALALVVLGTAYLTLAGRLDMAGVIVSTILLGSAFTFDAPTRMSLALAITSSEDALGALGLIRLARQAASIIGPLIAGLLILWLGPGEVMLVDGILFLAAGIGMWRVAAGVGASTAAPLGAIESFREGLAYVAHAPTLRSLMALNMVINAFAWSLTQLLPAFAHDALHLGALELSWLVSATGIGALAGALIALALGPSAQAGRTLIVSVLGLGALVALFGLQRILGPAIALAALIGAFEIVFFAGSANTIQLAAPGEMRGRVLGLHSLLSNAGTQLGILVLGALGSVIGIASALSLAGLVILAGGVLMLRVSEFRDRGGAAGTSRPAPP